jgi:hypothetical protein
MPADTIPQILEIVTTKNLRALPEKPGGNVPCSRILGA